MKKIMRLNVKNYSVNTARPPVHSKEIGDYVHMEEATITLGTSIGIGKVRLDAAEIRGAGDEYDPRLVIPIKIELDHQPIEHQIILVRLAASLHLDQFPGQNNQFAAKVSYDFIYNMPVRSVPGGVSVTPFELHFNLTHAQLKALENMRHQPGKNLYLHLNPIIAWNTHTGNSFHDVNGETTSTLGEDGWSVNVGLFSYFAFFWLPKIETLRLDLSAMDWAKKIFPGVGYDHFRLIEITLPSSSRLVPDDAIAMFEKARKDYDAANYPGCVEKCRFAVEALERHLSIPVHTHKLGDAVAGALGWSIDVDQCKFLNLACQAAFKLTSAAHHYPSTLSLLPADAHTALLSTATLLEYLGQLR